MELIALENTASANWEVEAPTEPKNLWVTKSFALPFGSVQTSFLER